MRKPIHDSAGASNLLQLVRAGLGRADDDYRPLGLYPVARHPVRRDSNVGLPGLLVSLAFSIYVVHALGNRIRLKFQWFVLVDDRGYPLSG